MTEVDICEECGEPFGFSGEDENGYNCTCIHCGNNTYFTTAQWRVEKIDGPGPKNPRAV